MLWSQPRVPEYFQVGKFPVFYIRVAEGGFYGFPIHGVPGMKIGKYHHRGGIVDPDTMDRQAHLDDEEVLREGIRRYFPDAEDRKSTRLNSSHLVISYAVFCF